jgi:hypothetical protein
MAVTVTVNSKPQRGVEHENGTGLDLRDGTLFVTPEGSARPIAMYAPGSWISAEVTK